MNENRVIWIMLAVFASVFMLGLFNTGDVLEMVGLTLVLIALTHWITAFIIGKTMYFAQGALGPDSYPGLRGFIFLVSLVLYVVIATKLVRP